MLVVRFIGVYYIIKYIYIDMYLCIEEGYIWIIYKSVMN